jgi:hypothetical protein
VCTNGSGFEIKENVGVGCVAGIREKKNAYRVLVRKTEGKRQLGRYRRRYEGNIKINLKLY